MKNIPDFGVVAAFARLGLVPAIACELILWAPFAIVVVAVDSNNNFHGVLVDAGNGKVLASTQMPMAAMMQSGMGVNLMGPGMGTMGAFRYHPSGP